MVITTLDPKGTHVNNSECPMRLAQKPSGQWACVDCGLEILHKRLEVSEDPMDRFQRYRDMAIKRSCEGVATSFSEVTPTLDCYCPEHGLHAGPPGVRCNYDGCREEVKERPKK